MTKTSDAVCAKPPIQRPLRQNREDQAQYLNLLRESVQDKKLNISKIEASLKHLKTGLGYSKTNNATTPNTVTNPIANYAPNINATANRNRYV